MKLSAHVGACQPLITRICESLEKATTLESIEIVWNDSHAMSRTATTAKSYYSLVVRKALYDAWSALLGPLVELPANTTFSVSVFEGSWAKMILGCQNGIRVASRPYDGVGIKHLIDYRMMHRRGASELPVALVSSSLPQGRFRSEKKQQWRRVEDKALSAGAGFIQQEPL